MRVDIHRRRLERAAERFVRHALRAHARGIDSDRAMSRYFAEEMDHSLMCLVRRRDWQKRGGR